MATPDDGKVIASDDSGIEKVTLDQAIGDIAGQVAKRVKKGTIVCVNDFNNGFDKQKSSGAGIRGKLIEKLKDDFGIEARESAPIALSGSFQVTAAEVVRADRTEKVPAAQIHFKLKTKNEVLLDTEHPTQGERPGYVTDKSDVAILGGLNIEVVPADAKKTNERMNLALEGDSKTASVMINGSRILPGPGSKFAIEILKAPALEGQPAPAVADYQAVVPILKDGVPFVQIEAGEVYAIRIYNEHDFEVVAATTIDALSLNHFSAERKYRPENWLIRPHRSTTLVGWHRGKDQFDRFLVSSYSKDDLAKWIADDSKFGQISVEFRASWPENTPPPPGEPADALKGSKSGYRTVFGSPISIKTDMLPRIIGTFRASVTVHYDR